jgi:cadmium resistance protein CadD (predicted permease)
MNKLSNLSNAAKLRAALYGLMSAILAVFFVKKLITEEEFVVYLGLGSAALGVAFYNVSDSDMEGEG